MAVVVATTAAAAAVGAAERAIKGRFLPWVAAAGGRRGGAEEGVGAGERKRTGGVSQPTRTKKELSTAQGTTFTQWSALTWGGDLGGDTGEGEFAAMVTETFQSLVQNLDGLEEDGLVLSIRLLPLGLLCVNLSGDGIDLLIQLAELLIRLTERDFFR